MFFSNNNTEDISKFSIGVRDYSLPYHWRESDSNFSFKNKKTILILPGSGTNSAKEANGMCKIVERMMPDEEKNNFQICSLYYANSYTLTEPTIIRAQKLLDKYIIPLVANKDEYGNLHRISAGKAAQNMRRLILFTHCYGGEIQKELDRQLQQTMSDLGYLAEERRFIHRQMVVFQHNNIDTSLEDNIFFSSQLIRISNADEEISPSELKQNTFRHFTLKHRPQENDVLWINLLSNCNVLLANRITLAGAKEHNGGYWQDSALKSIAGNKEEHIFQLVFNEVAESSYFIENMSQIIKNSLLNHSEDAKLMTLAQEKGQKFYNEFERQKKEIKKEFDETKEKIEQGTVAGAKFLPEVLLAQDKNGMFLLDYAFQCKNYLLAQQFFEEMSQYLPEKTKYGWMPCLKSKNQLKAIEKIPVWMQQAVDNNEAELFFGLSKKLGCNYVLLCFDKASPEIVQKIAKDFTQKSFPNTLDKQNVYAKSFVLLYKSLLDKKLVQEQKLMEKNIFEPEQFGHGPVVAYLKDCLYKYSKELNVQSLQNLMQRKWQNYFQGFLKKDINMR